MTTSNDHDSLFDTPSAKHWKEALRDQIHPDWAKDIDEFETELRLKKQGKIDDKVFAETRLRRGAYGQRYDNGKRNDGKVDRPIAFPSLATKGPNTQWDAPGMQRIKIPYGGLSPEQMTTLADLAEEYSDAILHVTTRQDFQLHYVHIEDTPAMFRRLAAAGITTREACGNTIRNITGCPVSGVCRDESFDVSPYAEAAFQFLLGHPDCQDFGRKFKISFSGCTDNPCALAHIHDIGFIAVTKIENGVARRGFKTLVGGGLGAVPYHAQNFSDFVSEEEFLPLIQAICRVFALYGEKKNRNKARLKFLLADWGLEKFQQEVTKERAKLLPDSRWTAFLEGLTGREEAARMPDNSHANVPANSNPSYQAWLSTNASAQRQAGYHTITIALPLGDITANQMRALTDIVRRFTPGTIRTSVEQNLILRWVKSGDLFEVFSALDKLRLADMGAGAIVDITACPGTDTCKLGISSSRGLAAVLKDGLAEKFLTFDAAVRNLHIKISGCFNSCGQHHVSDIGFYGVSRKVGNFLVPHFQLVLGGTTDNNGEAYGLAVLAIPAKAIPQTVDRLITIYLKERQHDESFRAVIQRLGKLEIKKRLDDLTVVPDHAIAPDFYVDHSDVREYSKSDIGVGECAGEVVSLADFGLKAAEREIFEAQLKLEAKDFAGSAAQALQAMLAAAEGLVKNKNPFVADRDQIIADFKTLYCDSKLFFDPFAGDKFANYFFKALAETALIATPEAVRQRVEEAQLFIEAAHSCLARMG